MADKINLQELPAAGTSAGAMARLFIVEAVSPGDRHRYKAEENLPAMRLMRRVIENRLKSPKILEREER